MEFKTRMTILWLVMVGLFLTTGLCLGSEVTPVAAIDSVEDGLCIGTGDLSEQLSPRQILSIKHEDYVLGMDDSNMSDVEGTA